MQDATDNASREAAAARSKELSKQALLEDIERKYMATVAENERLKEQLQTAQEQAAASNQERLSRQDLERKLSEQKHEAQLAVEKMRALEEQKKLTDERLDRSQAEGDSLREEIR